MTKEIFQYLKCGFFSMQLIISFIIVIYLKAIYFLHKMLATNAKKKYIFF